MTQIKSLKTKAFSSVALAFLALTTAHTTTLAATWTETGDAGDSLATAQSTIGTGGLTQISGTLPTDADLDLYLIRITDEANFLAYNFAVTQADPDLWLFDLSGNAVTFNNTTAANATKLTSTYVTANGLYYLGISNGGAVANSALGAIWNTGNGGPFTGERANLQRHNTISVSRTARSRSLKQLERGRWCAILPSAQSQLDAHLAGEAGVRPGRRGSPHAA